MTENRSDIAPHVVADGHHSATHSNCATDHRLSIRALDWIAVMQMNEIVNGHHEWHADERHDVVRRVKKVDPRVASNHEELAQGVLRRVDHSVLDPCREEGRDLTRPERDVLFAAFGPREIATFLPAG